MHAQGKPPSGERQHMACVAALNQAQVHYGKIKPTMCHNAAAYANTLRFTLPSLFWSVIHNRQQSHHTRPAGKRL
jgi:hypothetical protein